MANPLRALINLFSSKEPVGTPGQEDLTLVMGTKNPNPVARAVRMRTKALGRALTHESASATNRSGVSGFVRPVYDLDEVARAADVEPYISQSIRKHREMILKEGYDIEGEDEQMVSYIRKRLFDFQMVTDIPTEDWIREGLTNLVTFHNSGLVVRRDITRSRGSLVKRYNKILEPVAGIFVIDPTTMSVKVDKYGTIRRWEQRIEGGYNATHRKTFPPEDIIWVTLDKNTGFSFGTPYIVPVLDDVRALRRLEELALKLASKEVFPLYHYQVGTDQLPAEILDDGSDEVNSAMSTVQNLPIGGTLVTSHRHNISLVSRDGSGLDLNPFLEYFESRVMAGLRLSEIDLGRGGTANRACYSGDTETLTDSGWKHYSDIDIERDLIATVNPDTLQMEFHKANEKLVYPYTGPMYKFIGPNSDILVTPEHDMWVLSKTKAQFSKVPAKKLKTTSVTIQISASWDSEDQLETPELPIDANYVWDWIPFVALFVQYGKITPSKGEVKFIIRGNKVACSAAKKFLDNMKVSYRHYDNDSYDKIAINNYDIARHLARHCACKQYPKKIPEYITKNKTAANEFINAFSYAKGEGLVGDNTILYSRTHTISGQLQELALKAGFSATVLLDSNRDRIILSKRGQEDVTISQEDYNGDVYCFNVPNHLFVTRRNGKIAIQGNTAGSINKNVQDAAKDYQQAFANQITNRLFLPLLLEGGFNVTEDNLVRLTFPAIDREEMRAHQNHGLQLMLASATDVNEYRKEYLNKPPLSDEQKKLTTRELDAEIDEKLTRVAAAVKPAPASGGSSSAKKNTASSTKTASNRGQPRNQSGSKPAKTKVKANDYDNEVAKLFAGFRSSVISLVTAGVDEVSQTQFEASVKNLSEKLKTDCFNTSRSPLQSAIVDGADQAVVLSEDEDEDDILLGRRAKDKFIYSYSKNSLDIAIDPYVDQICRFAQSDIEGNNALYKVPGVLAALHNSLRRLVSDQLRTARRFGFARAARGMGYTSVNLGIEDGVRKTIEFKGSIMYRNLIPSLNEEDELQLGSKLINEEESDD